MSLLWNSIATTMNARRASPPRTPPTIAPVLFDVLEVAFECVEDEAGAEVMVDVVGIGDDEVAEDVEDADVTDGFALLRAEVVDGLECSEVVVGEYNKLSVIAALPHAIYAYV